MNTQANPQPAAQTPELIARAQALMASLREKNITFCAGSQKLEHLADALMYAREKLPKDALYMEAGVAMGGSAMLMALLKPQEARLKLYDVFELLPPPTEKDGAKAQAVYEQFQKGAMTDATSTQYLAHKQDLLGFVQDNFRAHGLAPEEYNVEFVKGLFEDTMRIDEPVAFCHIDCDWHEPVVYCINQVKDRMVPQGIIMFDDYNSFEGCRTAVDAWLAQDTRYRIANKAWNVSVQRVA